MSNGIDKAAVGEKRTFSFGEYNVLEKIALDPEAVAEWRHDDVVPCEKCGYRASTATRHLVGTALLMLPLQAYDRMLKEEGPEGIKDQVMVLLVAADGRTLRLDSTIKNRTELEQRLFGASQVYGKLL